MLEPYPNSLNSPSVDLDEIHREVENGYINIQKHPSLPISIFNYSAKAQFDWRWNDATKVCRGLVIDDQDQVVARPFQKVFWTGASQRRNSARDF